MAPTDYYQFCDNLWRDWVDRVSILDGPLSKRFTPEHCPEPYLRFGSGTDPVYFVLTNPGAGQSHHKRRQIFQSLTALDPHMRYRQIASELANWYEKKANEQKLNKSAKNRINAMRWLQQRLGKSSTVQFELIPFHSKNLPGKSKLLELMPSSPPLREYHELLRNQLQELSVIGLSAVGTAESISKQIVLKSPWLCWQMEIMGLDPALLELEPLVQKGRKKTSVFAFSQSHGRTSGIVLMMGSNSFPGRKSLDKLAEIMESQR
jgi:hypothetical protein